MLQPTVGNELLISWTNILSDITVTRISTNQEWLIGRTDHINWKEVLKEEVSSKTQTTFQVQAIYSCNINSGSQMAPIATKGSPDNGSLYETRKATNQQKTEMLSVRAYIHT